jgi:hypothetical protein
VVDVQKLIHRVVLGVGAGVAHVASNRAAGGLETAADVVPNLGSGPLLVGARYRSDAGGSVSWIQPVGSVLR